MAPRRGAASQNEPQLQTLDFNESLAMKPGRPIPQQQLLKRLKKLHEELAKMEQGAVDKSSLLTTAKELCTTALLQHKDEGVKALVACCLADMLKLHAPDAPYTVNQLGEIFELFIRELKNLDKQDHTYYSQYYYLLESLATIKSIVLMADLPNSESLIIKIFTNFFELVGSDIHPRAEYHIADILVQLVEEVNILPQEVIDIMLAQVKRASPAAIISSPVGKKKGGSTIHGEKKKSDQQTIVAPSQFPPAYNTTKRICTKVPEKMSRHICQYFSDVILEASPSKDAVDGEIPEPSAEDIEEMEKAHILIQELYFAVPDVLLNVVPLLEQEMLSENLHMRQLSASTVGAMATSGSFPTWSPSTWKAWLGRAMDKHPGIRANWVESACRTLAARVDVTDTLRPMIKTKLVDNDEKVRLAAVKGIGDLDWVNITTKLANDEDDVLSTLADRAKDKKFPVRSEAIRVLAKLWSSAYDVFVDGNSLVLDQLHWIPTKILDVMYVNDPETNIVLDQVVHNHLLPIPDPKDLQANKKSKKEKAAAADEAAAAESDTQATQRTRSRKGKEKEKEKETQPEDNGVDTGRDEDRMKTDRMLTLINALDSKSKLAFYSMPQNQSYYSKVVEAFLRACEDYNGGVMEEEAEEKTKKLETVIHTLSSKFGDLDRISSDLMKFAKKHDRRCYELFRKCISPESDYITVVTSIHDITKRMGSSANLAGHLGYNIMDTLLPVLYRCSLLIFNKSFVALVMGISRSEKGLRRDLGATAQEFLKEMSQSHPGVFKAHVKKLCELLEELAPTKDSYEAMADKNVNVVDTIKACSGFAKKFPADMPSHRKMMEALVNFALYGNSAVAAKHAVAIIMSISSKKVMYASDLIKLILKEWEYGSQHSIARLGALSQLMLRFAKETEVESEKIDRVLDIALKDILLKVRSQTDEDEDWDGESEPDDECKAKVLALKVIVNRLRNHADDEDGDTLRRTIAEPVFKIITALITNEGDISKKGLTPRTHRSILRLAAAKMVLKLGRLPNFEKIISHNIFTRLALMAQDPSFVVRQKFIESVKRYLASSHLPPRYYTIIFMVAHEPETEYRDEAMTWLKAKAKQMREHKSTHLETVFARFLSLLAHHPDFGMEKDDLLDFVGFILFYIRAVATEDNLPMLYNIAQRMKTVRDGLTPDCSDNLWCLSEIAQNVIQKYEDVHGWSMQTWPGTVRLPAGLFLGMKDPAMQHEVTLKTYMPSEMKEVISTMVTREAHSRKRKSLGPSRSEFQTPAKKRSKVTKMPAASTAAKRSTSSKKGSASKKKRDSIDTPLGERRKSGRITKTINYDDSEGVEDEDEMEWETEKKTTTPAKKRAAPAEESEEEEEEAEEEEVAEDDGEEEQEEEEEEDEEAEEPSPIKGKGKKAAKTTTAKGKGRQPAAAAAKGKKPAAAKEAPPASTRSTRATRGARTNGAKAVIAQKDDGDSDDEL